jgi:hypothetical protein
VVNRKSTQEAPLEQQSTPWSAAAWRRFGHSRVIRAFII